MNTRTWPVLALGFGSLVLLVLLFGLHTWKEGAQIYATMLSVHRSHAQTEETLYEIESGIYISSILIRDFLLDVSHLKADLYRRRLLDLRFRMEGQLATLSETTLGTEKGVLDDLRKAVDGYWDSMDPIFDWTPQEKMVLSGFFLRKTVLPRREGVLGIAHQAKSLNAASLDALQKQMATQVADYRRAGRYALVLVLSLAVVVSLGSIVRVSRLESRARQQHVRTEQAEKELRRLSQQLVHAQEEERRNLSRELHDEIGQTLTGLRVELGNLEKLRTCPEEQFHQHLEDAKELAAQTLRSVRSIAMGLRPSMLDDLGLGPALEWQAREFSRRTGIPVEVLLEGLRPDLPEGHRTCLYRVVQEALTNCARHAEAHQIRVALHTEADRLSLSVQDDGRGLPQDFGQDSAAGRPHLGLTGIEERVRELGGTLAVISQEGKGTLLKVSLPLPAEAVA